MNATPFAIFLVFFRIYLLAFGGVFVVLPELEKDLVIVHGWVTHEQFMQAFVLGQFLPGPNMVMCPLLGYWIGGWPGFAAGFAGIYGGAAVLMSAASHVYEKIRQSPRVRKFELGLRPAVTGLLIASVGRFGAEQATGIGASVWVARAVAALLAAAGLAAYLKRRITPTQLIFASGVVWWLAAKVL